MRKQEWIWIANYDSLLISATQLHISKTIW